MRAHDKFRYEERSRTLVTMAFTYRRSATAGLLLAAACLAPAAFAETAPPPKTALDLGDTAPVLQTSKWLKGEPIPTFQKGHVYVVELWATWCVPCRVSIPHLTKLAKEYQGKAEIIGVDVLENRDGSSTHDKVLTKAAAFVKSQGSKMDYHIAADTADNQVENQWLGAADEDGIPTAFVIGKDGHIAWIGHPMNLDPVLPTIINEKFDVTSARMLRDDLHSINGAIQMAETEQDYPSLLKIVDDASARLPDQKDNWATDRLLALLNTDYPGFKKQAMESVDAKKDDIDNYDTLCSVIADSPDLSPDAYQYGLVLVNQALKQPKNKEPFAFYYYGAQIYQNLGYIDSAVTMQETAVASSDADHEVSQGWKNLQHDLLAKYQLLALSNTNLPEFETKVRGSLKKNKNDVGAYASICKDIASTPGLSHETYKFGLALVDEALTQKKKQYMLYSRAAALNARLGDKEGAVRLQASSLNEVNTNPAQVSTNAKAVEATKRAEAGLLSKYKAAAQPLTSQSSLAAQPV